MYLIVLVVFFLYMPSSLYCSLYIVIAAVSLFYARNDSENYNKTYPYRRARQQERKSDNYRDINKEKKQRTISLQEAIGKFQYRRRNIIDN